MRNLLILPDYDALFEGFCPFVALHHGIAPDHDPNGYLDLPAWINHDSIMPALQLFVDDMPLLRAQALLPPETDPISVIYAFSNLLDPENRTRLFAVLFGMSGFRTMCVANVIFLISPGLRESNNFSLPDAKEIQARLDGQFPCIAYEMELEDREGNKIPGFKAIRSFPVPTNSGPEFNRVVLELINATDH